MNISAPFIRRPIMTTFIMLAIVIAGLLAFRKLPVNDLPNLEQPRIGVIASYAGASPETMVNMVTKPLEKELSNVRGVKEISSTSSRGYTSINLEFDLSKNLDEAARDVQTALNRAADKLPHDLDQKPTYFKQEANNEHIMYLLLTSPTDSISSLRDYSELYIEPRFSRIEGIANVEVFGASYSIKIRLNPDLMAARKIGINQVIQAIKEKNTDIPLGAIETGTKKLSIELNGSLQDAHEFEELIIAEGPIRLKDIGSVTDRGEDNAEFHYGNKSENKLTLILGIKKASGANTVGISKAVRAALPEITKDLPASMHFELWFDKAVWIKQSITDVEWSLAFAFVLVVIVIFLSLGRLSEALIPSIALPISLIGTFIAMYLLDFSIDILSLLALTLSVGFVVDDAIVVLENIVRHNEKSSSPLQASLQGSKEICFTILSMTISLVVIFIPLLFMSGMNGKLFYEFSVTLAIAILISGFISLTLTPMLCSKLLPPHNKETRLQHLANTLNKSCVKWYGTTLNWCLKHPKTILSIALICFAITVPLFQRLPVDLFPKEDRGFMLSIVNLPPGLSAEKAREYQYKIEQLLQNNTAIESFVDLTDHSTQIYVMQLLPHHQRPSYDQFIAEIQSGIDAIPGTQSFTFAWQLINVDMDITSGGDFKFLIRGSNVAEVEAGAEKLNAALQTNPDFTFARINIQRDNPKLVVDIQEDKAHQYGFSTYNIQSLIQQAFAGGSVANINKKGSQYKVYLELEKEYRNTANALSNLYLKAPSGEIVPLKSIASWRETMGSPSLHRIDQLPTVTLNFALNKDTPLIDGFKKLQVIASSVLPENVRGVLSGSAALVASATSDTGFLLLMSALVMYVILGMLYESFIHPLTILSSLPFAGLGGILTLLIFNEPLSIYSIVGFLLLIGIVKKNGIMIVDFALEARKDPLVTAEQAIFEGSMIRFRPIMMTTIAAIMGAVPIAIGIGEDASTRRGLGLVIVGGLLFSQLLILYVTPVIYLLLERLFSKKSANRVPAA